MISQNKPPTEKQFEILIRFHSDANRPLRVFYVYQKMKKFNFKPRVFLYNMIIDALTKNGYVDLAVSVYDDFRNDGLVEESVTFMVLIKGLCKVGRIDEMLKVLSKMRENLCTPDVFAYTAMVRVLVEAGNLDGCLRVWEEMRRDKVEPDAMAYTTLVTALCKGGRVEKGYELFREMKEKRCLIDRAIYGSLVDAFVVDGKVGFACGLLKDLVDSGYRADLGIYNLIIEGLCGVKRVDKAYKVFQVTVQEGLEPEFVTVNPILVLYAEMRRMDEFCKLLTQMEKLGFCVIDDLSKFFAFVVGKEERTLMAVEVFEDLKKRGYCSVSIYNILMGALHKKGEFKKVISLFDEVKESNFEPDSLTYSIAIECFVEIGDIEKACPCYNKIMEMSLVPSVAAYCALAKGLCKTGDIDAAMMLVCDCLANVTSGPMEFKYTLSVVHACKSGGAEKVIEVLNEMMQQGCPPDEIIYSAIISGMCKYGTIEEARKVFSNLRDRKLLTEANMIVYDEMLIEHMKKKTADLVVSGLKFFGLESKLKAKGTSHPPFFSTSRSASEVLGSIMTGFLQSSHNNWKSPSRGRRVILFQGSIKSVKTSCRISFPGTSSGRGERAPSNFLRDKKLVPDSDPPSTSDVNLLYQFFDQSKKLMVLSGAGISTECGIPDYRSPNGAYSSGFKPITHQEFLRSSRARRRYWARSYAGWRRFTAAQPGAAHIALASLEKAGRINFMITQNVDRLHHRAGSNPLELHGTVYTVVCLDCGFSFCRNLFQDQVKELNPKWAAAIESFDYGNPGSDKSFGMKQRPDGDIEIDEKFWEEDFHIPTCQKCNGVLKPDVIFFGDNVPKDRADKAMEAAKGCDAFLVLGSSMMTMSAFRLLRAAHEAGAATAIVNVGVTRADDIVPLKINARLGEILPRVLDMGSLSVPALL